MIEELYALERIKRGTCVNCFACNFLWHRGCWCYRKHLSQSKEIKIIEDSLKALEIIKETPEFAFYTKIYKDAYEMIADVKGFRTDESVEELQKKFNLLKKVIFR